MVTQILFQGCTLQQLAEELAPLLQSNSSNKEDENEFISIEDTCELLHLNKTSIWKHTKSGKLKSYGIGNRVLYKRSEVLEAVKPLNK
ncbi:helix-turn-helix domain-containing protein [Flavobacterium psychrophilum]|uniref:helix-turn-helix domain-containing protein n=1 Tax=Flavobacterium psychrophilum TaxID=96345 RepID=UPI001C8F4C57|nr:helix-turn-helix domain-containing protein [Flavobacterium psychrophilum]EKT3972896.1 helix-turn-helix domain-containing protein [Flavobacterium psychrophilum]EKT4499573.1 helix-turn-helix domain-containing protein [Flavobacterium psychrophilum]EKT4519239.1 helix-turn-helix domain-containing protein [Flavobacterium psychrophilum]EKT4535623.1 helix-turn-helix domain-containing protein [Flavobacterium psychrophilum]EKT4569975.1 helix-turn-helix domain-containing protein [Flavobacterium psychr